MIYVNYLLDTYFIIVLVKMIIINIYLKYIDVLY